MNTETFIGIRKFLRFLIDIFNFILRSVEKVAYRYFHIKDSK